MSEPKTPSLSILICTHDRQTMLGELLDTITQQTRALSKESTVELIVVDNHPLSLARGLVGAAANAAADSLAIRYATEPEPNIARARNTALRLASADLVLFLDDDQLPPREFLSDLLRLWKSHPADGYSLFKVPRFEGAPPTWLARSRLFEGGRQAHLAPLARTAMGTGGFLARRAAFAAAPFDPALGLSGGEDVDFFLRATTLGFDLRFAAAPFVYERIPASRSTLKYACASARRKGQVDARLFERNATPRQAFGYRLKSLAALWIALTTLVPSLLLGRARFARCLALVHRQLGKLTSSQGHRFYDQRDRVLHLTSGAQEGGAERLLEQISRHAPPSAPQPAFFLYDARIQLPFARAIAERGHGVITHTKRPGFDWRLLIELRRAVIATQSRIIHTHDIGAMLHASLVRLTLPRLRLIHTEHTLHYWIGIPKYRRLHRALSLCFGAIICVSEFVREELARHVHTTKRLLRVIPNGVDLARFRPTTPLQVPADRLRLVSIGRIDAAKNLADVIRSVGRLHREGVAIELHHAGTGPEEDVVRRLIRDEGLESIVHLHGFQEDVLPILNKGEIFVSASRIECHPVAVLEAMAAGKLCLLSSIPPHSALAGMGVALFDLEKPTTLDMLLRQTLNAPAAFQDHPRAARDAAERRFSITAMLAGYQRLYAEM